MDQGTVQGIGTLLAMLAFIAVCLWAYSGRNKERFEEAARLPFADDLPAQDTPPQTSSELDEKPEVDKVRGNE